MYRFLFPSNAFTVFFLQLSVPCWQQQVCFLCEVSKCWFLQEENLGSKLRHWEGSTENEAMEGGVLQRLFKSESEAKLMLLPLGYQYHAVFNFINSDTCDSKLALSSWSFIGRAKNKYACN